MEIGKSRQVFRIAGIGPDQYAVRLQDEQEVVRNQFEDPDEMFPANGRLVSAYSQLVVSFPPGDGNELPGDFFRRVEIAVMPRLDDLFPGPAENTSQAAADRVRG